MKIMKIFFCSLHSSSESIETFAPNNLYFLFDTKIVSFFSHVPFLKRIHLILEKIRLLSPCGISVTALLLFCDK